MREFLFESLVHVLLQVKRFDVFDDRGLKQKPEPVSKRAHTDHGGGTNLDSYTQVLDSTG